MWLDKTDSHLNADIKNLLLEKQKLNPIPF